jgi:hypothetical protein
MGCFNYSWMIHGYGDFYVSWSTGDVWRVIGTWLCIILGYRRWQFCCKRGRRGRKCLQPLTLWVRTPFRRGALDTTLWDKVCQWFSPGTPVSFPRKTARHDIAEILLKEALSTTTLPPMLQKRKNKLIKHTKMIKSDAERRIVFFTVSCHDNEDNWGNGNENSACITVLLFSMLLWFHKWMFISSGMAVTRPFLKWGKNNLIGERSQAKNVRPPKAPRSSNLKDAKS